MIIIYNNKIYICNNYLYYMLLGMALSIANNVLSHKHQIYMHIFAKMFLKL